jgi:hypothetical protein
MFTARKAALDGSMGRMGTAAWSGDGHNPKIQTRMNSFSRMLLRNAGLIVGAVVECIV